MKKTFTKSLALVLALLMALTALPMGVFATVDPETCDHNYTLHAATEATATKHGNTRYYKCDKCGTCFSDTLGTVIENEESTLIHHYATWNPTSSEEDQKALVSPASCTAKAVYYKKCSVAGCGKLNDETFEFGEMLPHLTKNDVDWTIPAGADCTKAGFVCTKTCVCGLELDRKEIAKGDHDPELTAEIAPQCNQVGHKIGMRCKNCLRYTEGGQDIPVVDHKLIIDVAAVKATCTTDGKTEGHHCQWCETQTVKSQTIPKLNHKGGWAEVKTKEKTCTEDGYKMDATVCTLCKAVFAPEGKTTEDVFDLARGHHDIEKVAERGSTVSEHGCIEHYACKDCDKVFLPKTDPDDGLPVPVVLVQDADGTWGSDDLQEVPLASVEKPVEPHEHQWEVDEADSKAMTCLEDGKDVKICKICKEKNETILKSPGHHTFNGWTVKAGEEPTCIKEGTMFHKCTVCGAEIDVSPMKKIDHNYQLVSSADCTTGGKNVFKCSMCGDIKEEEVTKQTKHSDGNDDGVCDVCGTEFCKCLCHKKQWYYQMIYFFVKVWWEFLGWNQTCACGKVHYNKITNLDVPSAF